jgi:hypothetical protein
MNADRKKMIVALTKYELQYLLDNPDQLDGNTEFFALGGFTAYSNAELQKQCLDNVWIEMEEN